MKSMTIVTVTPRAAASAMTASAGHNQLDEAARNLGFTSAEVPAPQMAASPLIRAGFAIGDSSPAGLVIAFDTGRLSLARARSLGHPASGVPSVRETRDTRPAEI
jgi:hypothetical protein